MPDLSLIAFMGTSLFVGFSIFHAVKETEKILGEKLISFKSKSRQACSQILAASFRKSGARVEAELLGLPTHAFLAVMKNGERILVDLSCWDGKQTPEEAKWHVSMIDKTMPDRSLLVSPSGRNKFMETMVESLGKITESANLFRIAAIIRDSSDITAIRKD